MSKRFRSFEKDKRGGIHKVDTQTEATGEKEEKKLTPEKSRLILALDYQETNIYISAMNHLYEQHVSQ